MKHLDVDEMMDFVSFDRLDKESLALASKVNAHIFGCGACRKKVEALQTVYDELVKSGKQERFKNASRRKRTEPQKTIDRDKKIEIDLQM